MKDDRELKELNEFLLSKSENDDELKKIVNNSKFQLLIDRILEIEQLKKELLEMSEKNEKLDIYFKNWMEIVKYFYLIDVYEDYKNTFLDENNNFIETDEKIYIVGFLDETNERKKGIRYEPFDVKFNENEDWVKKIYFKDGTIYIWNN